MTETQITIPMKLLIETREALDEAEATASQMAKLIHDDPHTDSTSKNVWILHEHYLKERDQLNKLKSAIIDLIGDCDELQN